MSDFYTKQNGIVLIGSRNTPNVDIRIDDDIVKTTRKITHGRNADSTFIHTDPMIPFAIGIIYGSLVTFNLKEGNSYLSLNNEDIFTAISQTLVDLVVVAPPESPIVSGCNVFDKLHREWGAFGDYVLTEPTDKHISLSRCLATTIRFMPQLYRKSCPTPGHPNKCSNDANFQDQDLSSYEESSTSASPRRNFIPILVNHDGVGGCRGVAGGLAQGSDDNFIPFRDEETEMQGRADHRAQGNDDFLIPILNDGGNGVQSSGDLFIPIADEREMSQSGNVYNAEGHNRFRRMDPMEECTPNRPSQAVSPMDQQPGNQQEPQGASALVNYVRASRANADLSDLGAPPKEYLWATERYFNKEWLEQMKQYQAKIIPWEYLSGETGKGARQWIEYLFNEADPAISSVRCWICFLFYDALFIQASWKSEFAKEAGMKPRSRKADYKTAIETHEYSPGHKGVVKELMLEHVETLEQMFEILQKKDKISKVLKKTANHIMSVYTAILWNFSFARYEELIKLQEHNEALIGQFLRGENSMQITTMFLSEIMDKNLADYLLAENLPLSLLVDESTNRKHENFLIILIQIPQNHWPAVYYLDFVQVTAADADSLFAHIKEAFEIRGLLDYLRNRLIAIASDGASVMVGKASGLCQKFVQWAIQAVQCLHCMAHRNNLITKWGLKLEDWYMLLEDMSKRIYSHYQTGHKNRDSLIITANQMGVRIYAIRLLYDIRWLSAADRTFRNHIKNWKLYITDLNSHLTDKEGKAKAKSILEMLLSRENLLAMMYGVDITAVFGEWSRNLQYSGDLIFSKHREKRKVKNILKKLKENPGEMLKKFMGEVTCSGNLPVSDQPGYFTYLEEKTGCSVHEISYAETVTWQGIVLSPPSDTGMPKLDEIRESTVENLLNEIEYYFPSDNFLDSFSVFDPALFPLDSSLVATYGEDKIVSVAKILNPQSSPEYLHEVVNEWKTLMQQFLNEPNFAKDIKQIQKSSASTTAPRYFWFKYLTKLPDKFIFPQKIKDIIDNSIAIPASTADAERGFSLMTAIVTKYRNCLATKTVAGLLRVKMNGPPREKLPAGDLARHFVVKHMRVDDPAFYPSRTKRPKMEKNTIDMCEEDDTENSPNSLRGKSMLYTENDPMPPRSD